MLSCSRLNVYDETRGKMSYPNTVVVMNRVDSSRRRGESVSPGGSKAQHVFGY